MRDGSWIEECSEGNGTKRFGNKQTESTHGSINTTELEFKRKVVKVKAEVVAWRRVGFPLREMGTVNER